MNEVFVTYCLLVSSLKEDKTYDQWFHFFAIAIKFVIPYKGIYAHHHLYIRSWRQ